MFELQLTYNQVLNVVRDMAEAERLSLNVEDNMKAFCLGQAEAYRGILEGFYTKKEIAEMVAEINDNKGGV